ncbi:MAG: DUF924 domain-containing protein, partial [Gammaproteobacteria bacterium]|nr:DUF924 domain-containing protein [Gammaproteobacteria bacterium]
CAWSPEKLPTAIDGWQHIRLQDIFTDLATLLFLALAQEAVQLGVDAQLTTEQKAFLYMPYMHSESLVIHDVAMQLYDQPGLEYNLEFEVKHRDIIVRFGRYPHRNALLGRQSTTEEQEFLTQPGSSF